MKRIIYSMIALGLGLSSMAQINIGANFVFAFPTGDFGDVVGTAVGGGLEANFYINEQFAIGPEVQFTTFGERDDWDFSIHAQSVPISFKGEYYFKTTEWQPYVGLGLGYYIVTTSINLGDSNGPDVRIDGFGMSPRFGVLYKLSPTWAINFNGQYNLIFGQSWDEQVWEDLFDPLGSTDYFNLNLGVRYWVAE